MQFSALLSLLLPVAVNAQSAKFSAGWRTDNQLELAMPEGTGSPFYKEALGKIKSAKNKELLIGLSGVANLLTFTQVKGKNLEGETVAVAEATLKAHVVLVPDGSESTDVCDLDDTPDDVVVAAPGQVTFSSRTQTLAIETALTVDIADSDLVATIEGYVQVSLELDTTAAHHFNFVAYDLDSDVYNIVVCWNGSASGTVDENGVYGSMVAVKSRMLTAQAVRAVKTSDGDIDIGSGNLRA